MGGSAGSKHPLSGNVNRRQLLPAPGLCSESLVKSGREGEAMRWYGRRQRSDGLITATEIACFAYCPEQWRLEYGLHLPANNQAARDAGTRHHTRLAAAERRASWALRLGQALVLAALALLLLWILCR
jgi:hypothetical protein